MLLLFYVLLTVYYVFFSMGYDFVKSIYWIGDTFYYKKYDHNENELVDKIMIIGAFIVVSMVVVLLTFFTKFHVWLVRSNKTTIENLEKKGQ